MVRLFGAGKAVVNWFDMRPAWLKVVAVAPHVPCASARVPVQLAVGKVMEVVQEAEQPLPPVTVAV